MELGEKIRQARLEAGLSQRQLCGGEITRNMLSLIENGSAKPSMKTLQYLSRQLNKPLSFFLEQTGEQTRRGYQALELLDQAEEALAQGRDRYARELLDGCAPEDEALLRRKLLLQARLPDPDLQVIVPALPSLDEELLLRAQAALQAGQIRRCAAMLAAVESQDCGQFHLLTGRMHLASGDHAPAAQALHRAEADHPGEVIPLLEICYRELGDFQKAYHYACLQKT